MDDAPVAVYNARRPLMAFLFIFSSPMLIACLIDANFAFTNPKPNPAVGVGFTLLVPTVWTLLYVFVRFQLPRVEFYREFARCFRGLAKPNDIPYDKMRLTYESARGVPRKRCLIWDTRQPFLAPYAITRTTLKSLNMSLFDWLEDKVRYGGLYSSGSN